MLIIPFAIACNLLPQRAKTDFSGEQALAYAQDQVNFGPRVPGTPAHEKAGDWIIAQMRTRADTVIVQSFMYKTLDGRSIPMRNIIARFRPDVKQRVLYMTHWDTRPVADDDPNLGKRQQSFDAANDGASGVGLFVALGDALKKKPPTVGVDLLFTDGEDWGDFENPKKPYIDTMTTPDVLIGFRRTLRTHLPDPGYKPIYGVLWDMIGDARTSTSSKTKGTSPRAPRPRWWSASGRPRRSLGYSKYLQAKNLGTR